MYRKAQKAPEVTSVPRESRQACVESVSTNVLTARCGITLSKSGLAWLIVSLGKFCPEVLFVKERTSFARELLRSLPNEIKAWALALGLSPFNAFEKTSKGNGICLSSIIMNCSLFLSVTTLKACSCICESLQIESRNGFAFAPSSCLSV